ncbi:MAG: M14 family zinc carboxypeptidase [Phycisphaerales bacterium JB060]
MKPYEPFPYRLVGLACVLSLAGLAACASQSRAPADDHPPHADQPPRAVLTSTPTASSVVGLDSAGSVLTVDRSRIGTTAGDQPIYVYRVSQGEGDPDTRPGLLIVAGLDGRHTTGPAVARELVGHLEREADLANTTVYVIPRVNRDAQGRDDTTAAVPGGTLTPEDADRDGRIDEDGPTDLNGDGHITMMRIGRPVPRYGIELTHVVDPEHPRLMRRADASSGEVATHALLSEAADQDGDGLMGEDGVGGVDLNKNFPYRWPEFANHSGAYPLSEAESKALATWLLERPNVMAAIVYGPHDTIINVPASSGYDHTGRVPTGLERADKDLMDRLSEQYKEATGLSSAEKVSMDGSFAGWAYAHLGLITIATNPWQRPEAPKEQGDEGQEQQATDQTAEAPTPDEPPFVMIGDYKLVLTQSAIQNALAEAQTLSEAEQAERMEAFQGLPAATRERIMTIAQGAPDPMAQARPEAPRPTRRARGGGGKDSDDAKWLAYADRVGSGFIDWKEVDHPQLGTVEVGVFVPGF